ncbi:MarR family winged helix-turn-helix transcriptional regulator [Dactylosporangium cerinum]|uniref:MarR family winged helix-turn-helix transcriptional regulator n=1 Tax=Dactylosporangium cerinum TaxID=1434730 RepID=A0ABV9W9X3_9ACTN
MHTELGGGPALFRLVRFWSRRWAAGITQDEGGEVAHIQVLEAIDASGRPAQIGAVAVELGLDRSNASRMLAASVAAGLVTKTVSAQDARRTDLDLTPAGSDLLAAARAWQEQTFARMVADWPARDARRFAAYLVRLAASEGTSP